MSRFDNERKKSGYTENNLKKELKVEEVEEEEEEEVEVLNNIMNSNNETTTSANDNKIADVILAMFQIQATLRVSHFLSEKKSDHETLDKFLKKFNKKMDKFIEVWMGKHKKFDLGKNRQVNVYQITKDELFDYLDLVLEFLTGDIVESNVYKLSKYPLKNVMNNKKNVDLMSIRDDIVKNINRMKYRLRLQ